MKISGNNLAAVFDYSRLQIGSLYDEREVIAQCKLVLNHLFGYDSKYLALHPGLRFTESELLQIIGVFKELKTGRPIQYVLGETAFCGLTLKVNEDVLIPRPETEELVDLIIKDTHNSSSEILDIGTGSGCIALALKQAFPNAQVTATDISEAALSLAQENSELTGLRVSLIQDNALHSNLTAHEKKFDVIVSNPPYVRKSEADEMHINVLKHEPPIALFVEDNDALVFYRSIAELALKISGENAKLYFEINEAKGPEIVELLEKLGYSEVFLMQDLNGRDRMVRASLV